jgi:repressor LexA
MTNDKLSDTQQNILKYIRDYFIKEGKTPTIRQMTEEFNFKSTRSITFHLESLIKQGYLSKEDNGRIKIMKEFFNNYLTEQTVPVPVVGTVSCGPLLLAVENISEYLTISTHIAKPPHKYFILKATGDSMNMAGINEGDYVLIKQTTEVKDRDKVVALVNDEATIKEYQKKDDIVLLKPKSDNPEHKPLIVSENLIILGVVIRVLPQFDN